MASLTQSAPRPSRFREFLYLDLTLIGSAVPLYLLGNYFLQNGMSVPLFVSQAFANGVSSGLISDLLIASGVFWIMAAREIKAQGKNSALLGLFVALNLGVGLSCALPAFLWWRERQLKKD